MYNYICRRCKKLFQAKIKNRLYCSQTCFHKDRIGFKAPHWQGGQIKRKCLICNKIFYVDKNEVDKGNANFCSRNCAGKRKYGHYYAPKKELYCIICDKRFYDYVSRLIKDKTRGKCCSKECRIKYTQQQTSGSKNYRWKGGITPVNQLLRSQMKTRNWSRAVKERDNFTCQKCGIRCHKGLGRTIKLHSHHIKSWKDYPKLRYELSNGMTLCKDCHKALLKKKNMAEACLEMLR